MNTKPIRLFLICLLLTFIMVMVPHFGTKPVWVSPASKKEDIVQKIQPKLEIHQNSFQLKKQLIPTISAGSDYEQTSAYAVTDLDNGQILVHKNLSKRLPIASLTKLMTAVVALDLASPDEEFTVSEKASRQIPTKVMLKPGEKYPLRELLSAALISSANDSTQVIKEGIDAKFGEEVFIKAMNLKAQFLGLKNSNFTNPQGFDNDNHYSSAEDLSILSAYALKEYPLIAEIVAKEYEDLTQGGTDLRFFLNNWNGLMGVYPGVSGIKIGNTARAGYTTIVVAEREGKKLVAVVLGTPGVLERDLWAAALLDLGFNKVAGLEPVDVTKDQLLTKYASWKYFLSSKTKCTTSGKI